MVESGVPIFVIALVIVAFANLRTINCVAFSANKSKGDLP
jgi:hypothetical protein